MELKEIQNLIKFVAKSGVNEVHVEMGETKVTIKTGGGVVQQVVTASTAIESATPAAPVAAPAAAPATEPVPPAPAAAKTENDNHITIKSPIIGTFYRKPSPDKPNFVEAGDQVNEGDVLCVVEAMKLFNEIESEVSGTIVKVLVDDSSPVEFDQPLFIIDPS
ncbi:MAG: acetyl-CoA carboxylase biotin carboxyl carrier protein [Flavobacteriales bacterium]|nr:acetyl-CoA carboxylase biotin carboxyl carrier protein [Flavobacteriales bacterium]